MRRMAQTPIDKSRLGSQRCANPGCWLRLKLSHEVPPLGQVGISRHRSFKTSSLHPHAREALVSERPVPGSHPAMLLPPKVPYPFHRPMTPNKKQTATNGRLLEPFCLHTRFLAAAQLCLIGSLVKQYATLCRRMGRGKALSRSLCIFCWSGMHAHLPLRARFH